MGVLFILAAVALAVFIATFDLDKYRPLVARKLGEALGVPVTLGRLSLGFKGGVALELKELTVSDLLQVESAFAVIRLSPLLKRQLEVVSVTVNRPRIELHRRPDGTVQLGGLKVPKEEAASAAPAAGVAAFLIRELRVEGASIHLRDETQTPPLEVTLEGLDGTLRNVSPGKPVALRASASRLTVRQNLSCEEILFDGSVGPGTVEVRHLSFKVADGTIAASGTLDARGNPDVHFHLDLEHLAVEKFLPAPDPALPQLKGFLTGVVEGTVKGRSSEEELRTLTAQGRFAFREGAIENVNLVRTLFQKLSILPGLVEALEARLPDSYRQKLTMNETKFLEPIECPITIQDGALLLQELTLVTDTFTLQGGGTIGLDGSVSGKAEIRLEPELSQAFIQGAKELASLTDEKGQITFPFKLEGKSPRVIAMPDLKYIASRLATSKAQEWIGELLAPKESSQPVSPDGTTAPSQPTLLDTILQKALEKKK